MIHSGLFRFPPPPPDFWESSFALRPPNHVFPIFMISTIKGSIVSLLDRDLPSRSPKFCMQDMISVHRLGFLFHILRTPCA